MTAIRSFSAVAFAAAVTVAADTVGAYLDLCVANTSLGLMLGLVPPIAAFFGLPLEVRHVTLSTGQIAAALMAGGGLSLLGLGRYPDFGDGAATRRW